MQILYLLHLVQQWKEVSKNSMDKQYYHDNIVKVIEAFSYKFYVVIPDHSVACSCTCHTTKDPDPTCKKCLGTGYRITIKQIKGASNEELKAGNSLSPQSSRVVKNYFILAKYPLKENDYIIDENEIYYVFRNTLCRGLEGEKTHQELIAARLNNNHDVILNNFNEIINKSKRKK